MDAKHAPQSSAGIALGSRTASTASVAPAHSAPSSTCRRRPRCMPCLPHPPRRRRRRRRPCCGHRPPPAARQAASVARALTRHRPSPAPRGAVAVATFGCGCLHSRVHPHPSNPIPEPDSRCHAAMMTVTFATIATIASWRCRGTPPAGCRGIDRVHSNHGSCVSSRCSDSRQIPAATPTSWRRRRRSTQLRRLVGRGAARGVSSRRVCCPPMWSYQISRRHRCGAPGCRLTQCHQCNHAAASDRRGAHGQLMAYLDWR